MTTITRRIAALAAFAALACFGSPAVADQITLLSVPSGHSAIINAPGLTRVATGDGKIAGVRPVGTSEVIINGKEPGHTTIVVWAGGRRTTYEVTVTFQYLDDISQMLRTAIDVKGVEVVTFDHSIVVRGSVGDGAQFQQVADIVARFVPVVVQNKSVIINAVTVSQNMGNIQHELARLPGARDIRVDPDGKGNVIVSGNVNDAVTAQAILDRARGLAGPYLASNGQLIDRLSSLNNSQIDVKVYVLEVDKTAQSNLGIQLQGAQINPTQPGTYSLVPPCVSVRRSRDADWGCLHGTTLLPHDHARADAQSPDDRGARAHSVESRLGHDTRQQGNVSGGRTNSGGHLDRFRSS